MSNMKKAPVTTIVVLLVLDYLLGYCILNQFELEYYEFTLMFFPMITLAVFMVGYFIVTIIKIMIEELKEVL